MKAVVGIAALLLSMFLVIAAARSAPAQTGDTVLHWFSNAEGSEPLGGLVIEGGRLYGTTEDGGAAGSGAAFGLSTDGAGFSTIHSFPDPTVLPLDGTQPSGGLISVGGKLYGVTKEGGMWGEGSLFSMNPDGGGYAILHNFQQAGGMYPVGPLAFHDGVFYGVTTRGGGPDDGVVYSITISGTSYSVLHEFGASPGDGGGPNAGPLLRDGVLYGTTNYGGTGTIGTVYSIGTGGGGYSILYDFSGVGAVIGPWGTLASDGSRLYGVALYGGAANYGTVFSLAVGGGAFAVLHEFAGPPGDGAGPAGSLALDGGLLYGTTILGGQHSPIGGGTLFSLQTDGSGYTILHHFAGDGISPPDGCQPKGDLLVSGGTIYGTTIAPGDGTVYALPLGSLRLTPNQTTVAAGSRLTLDVEVKPITQAFDAWAVIMGAGASYSMVLGSPGEVRAGLQPLARNVGGLPGGYSGRLLDLAIPTGAAGAYEVIVGLVPAGTSPTGVESAIAGYVDQRAITVR